MQWADEPAPLFKLVSVCTYRPGWEFCLDYIDRGQNSKGLTLIVTVQGYNSYCPENGETYRTRHYMPVPPMAYDERSWKRWLFDQLMLIETHECCEFFKIDGKRAYPPRHKEGDNQYIVFDRVP